MGEKIENLRMRKVKKGKDRMFGGDKINIHYSSYKEQPDSLEFSYLRIIAYLMFGFIVFCIASWFDTRLPLPKQINSDGFIAERAINDLKGLVKIGPKVTGSVENEVKAVKYIMNIIDEISKAAKPYHTLQVDVQKVSGSFSIMGIGLQYDNVQNIIVKLGARHNESLLINCHFDTVPTSPGASDDGLNCAVMLEILRVIVTEGKPLSYGVIFLFNGAEENPLMAAHGFITKHKWASQAKAFINLESCGAGGHEMLFQTGPYCSWIVEAYAGAVKHPSGNVIGEELFQSGIIPSDTDFRIFRDYGHIPGLDFAHCSNGYVYHTKYDNLESINNLGGVIQHTGDNILSMVLILTGSVSKLANSDSDGIKQIYYDILGLFFITYPNHVANVLNFIPLFMLLFVYIFAPYTKEDWKSIVHASEALLIGLLFSLIYNASLAFIVDFFSKSMLWFTSGIPLVIMYVLPPLVIIPMTMANFHRLFFKKKVKKSYMDKPRNPWMPLLSTQLFWTFLLIILTLLRVRSALICLVLVLPPACIACLNLLWRNNTYSKALWWIYLASTCLCSLQMVYFGIKALKLFLPITGRAGPAINTDLLIAVLVTLLTFITYSYLYPIMAYRCQWKNFIVNLVAACHIVFIIFAISSKFYVPFSPETPQRILITDVTRNSSGHSDSFLWIEFFQRRGSSVHPAEIETLPTVKQFCTETSPTCGLPWSTVQLLMKSIDEGRWVPSKPHNFVELTQLHVLSDEKIKNSRILSLNMTGPDRMTLIIHTKLTLSKWSLDNLKPSSLYTSSTGKTYAIRHVHGLETPYWNVTLEFQDDDDDKSGDNIHMDLIGHYIHGENQTSPRLRTFIEKLPDWVHVTPSLATLKSYNF